MTVVKQTASNKGTCIIGKRNRQVFLSHAVTLLRRVSGLEATSPNSSSTLPPHSEKSRPRSRPILLTQSNWIGLPRFPIYMAVSIWYPHWHTLLTTERFCFWAPLLARAGSRPPYWPGPGPGPPIGQDRVQAPFTNIIMLARTGPWPHQPGPGPGQLIGLGRGPAPLLAWTGTQSPFIGQGRVPAPLLAWAGSRPPYWPRTGSPLVGPIIGPGPKFWPPASKRARRGPGAKHKGKKSKSLRAGQHDAW